MSYILDALKKSEQERDLGVLQSAPTQADFFESNKIRLWPRVMASVALLMIVIVATMWWRIYIRPQIAFKETLNNASITVATPASSALPTLTQGLAGEAHKPQPALDLEEQAGDRTEFDTTLQVDGIKKSISLGAAKSAEPVALLTADNSVPEKQDTNVLFLHQLPEDFQKRLPILTVNIHVYSPDKTQCVLYINNHQYHEGEFITAGVRVEQITSDGVILSYQGKRFKLPRPN